MLIFRRATARSLLAVALLASGLAVGHIGAAAAQTTVRFVPHADLQALDPMGSTVNIVKMHGFMIYDTLYALDENFVPRPQMVESMTTSDSGKIYRFVLRDGLLWHDGTVVKAEDCVASLERWAARDAAGQLMNRVLKEMRVVDDKTFELEFAEPYGLVLDSLSKVASKVPFMMPKRIAETDPYKEVSEYVGSGPFRFVKQEWVPGVKVVYEKFADYVPRNEPPSGFAGRKIVNIDRVEWVVVRDQQTALSALFNGEVDFWENPSFDLLPVLKATKGIETAITNKTGIQAQIYFNHVIPPFNHPKARQAMLHLTKQENYLQAINGNPEFYRVCPSFFTCGTPMETDACADALKKPDPEKARALFKEAGWDFSKPIVVLDPTDEGTAHPATVVTVQAMRDIGLTVDVQAMDWATMLKRRNSKEQASNGGWNVLHSFTSGLTVSTPVWSIAFSGACEKGLFGWPCDQKLEDLRMKWALTDGVNAKKQVAAEYSRQAFAMGHHVPLGQWTTYVAHSAKLSGILDSQDVTVFWNLKKAK